MNWGLSSTDLLLTTLRVRARWKGSTRRTKTWFAITALTRKRTGTRTFTYSYLQLESLFRSLKALVCLSWFSDTLWGGLSDNVESLNLLQYVSDFRAKLTGACELARENLISAQKSMKARYDRDTVEHDFEPGQKALALLPVPGSPLHDRYLGPYVEEKEIKWS